MSALFWLSWVLSKHLKQEAVMLGKRLAKKYELFSALVVVMLLVACTGVDAPTKTDAPTPTSTLKPTITRTPTATVTTVAPSPTATAEPTVAKTPAVTQTEMAETPKPVETESRTWSSASPDGEWSAQGLAEFPVDPKMGYYTQLKVVKADGTVQWTLVDEWLETGLGYTVPQPFYWSPNGQYFYFTNYPSVDGCAVFVNGTDLHRVDLADGSVVELAPSSGLWLSLSPDETTLAYVGYGERGLVLRDLGTGAEREIKLDPGQGYAAGHIVWSPDGAALALTLALKPCSTNWAAAVAVMRVDVETLETRTLIQEDERLFITAQWPEPDQVLLQDKAGNSWWMDANTGQVGEQFSSP
jgi:hypothetical protein